MLRLTLALPLLGTGLAGCSVSPTVDGPSQASQSTPASGSPSPGPAPSPTVPAAATAEQQLSAYAAGVLAGPHRKDLDGPTKTLLRFLRDAHGWHATALAGADPTSRPTTATPAPTAQAPNLRGMSLATSLSGLARAESAQAARQRRAAVAGSGLTALLSGSLAVAAASYASALGVDRPPGVTRLGTARPAPLLSDVAALQAVVAQLHALVYGYQTALGRLKVGSGARTRAYAGLADARVLRDELATELTSRRADVPAAEPAYAPSPDPRTAADAGRLIRTMQTRLQPYAGMLLAAAGSSSDRTRALGVLTSTTTAARAWGAPLLAWPGWPDVG